MCPPYQPTTTEMVIALANTAGTLLLVGYNIIVGAKGFFSWTRKRGFQSLKVMGLIASIICFAYGWLYAGWDSMHHRVTDVLCLSFAFLFVSYPIFDLISWRCQKSGRVGWRIPFAIIGLYLLWVIVIPMLHETVKWWDVTTLNDEILECGGVERWRSQYLNNDASDMLAPLVTGGK